MTDAYRRTTAETIEENKQLILDANAVFSRGEFESFLSFFADDFVFTLGGNVAIGESTVVGVDTFRSLLQQGFSGNPEQGFNGKVTPLRFEIEQMICAGEYVTEIARGFGFTTEGRREYNNKYCRIWQIRNRKVISLIEFLNTAYFNKVVLEQ